jgi:tetratricopeptide (TPR) repeat protein
LASAQGWAALGRRDRAQAVYDQVFLIALHSPYLQVANRRDLLVVLEDAYRDLGTPAQADACREKIIELDQDSDPQPPDSPGRSPDLPRGEDTVSSAEVGALEEARRQEAFVLLDALAAGKEPSPGLVSGLAEALQDEDAAKLDLYRQELEGTTLPGRRIEVHWHVIRWLMLKYQVAAGGYGLSLVPDWEAKLADIQSDLSRAYDDLRLDYEDLVAALPDASLVGPGSYQVRREMLLAGRLGRYANYPALQLAEKLQDAVANLIAAGSVDRLYVDVATGEEALQIFLSPAEEYGLSTPSP